MVFWFSLILDIACSVSILKNALLTLRALENSVVAADMLVDQEVSARRCAEYAALRANLADAETYLVGLRPAQEVAIVDRYKAATAGLLAEEGCVFSISNKFAAVAYQQVNRRLPDSMPNWFIKIEEN